MKQHLIDQNSSIAEALERLNTLGQYPTLFVTGENSTLVGTLTDGDVRRGLLKRVQIDEAVSSVMNTSFRSVKENQFTIADIDRVKKLGIKLLPVVDSHNRILRVINFDKQNSLLPLDCIVMAGGEGQRLRPLTEKTPKPLLKIGDKPIIEHVLDRLSQNGIRQIVISVNYLGQQISDHLKNGEDRDQYIRYVHEPRMMGTIGSVSLIEHPYSHQHVLIMNSDLLTNIDLEEFYREFIDKDADMSVACTPYNVNIPYAILDTHNEQIKGLNEKPTLTYYSNAGIYLVKKELLQLIPKDSFYNATDFIELLIQQNKKVVYYPILGYWLDIGKMDDFYKAQEDIKHIRF
jgi:dTDP-glucose pyrophosphorylase